MDNLRAELAKRLPLALQKRELNLKQEQERSASRRVSTSIEGRKEMSSSRFRRSSLQPPGEPLVPSRTATPPEGTACSRGTSIVSRERQEGVWFVKRAGGGSRVLERKDRGLTSALLYPSTISRG